MTIDGTIFYLQYVGATCPPGVSEPRWRAMVDHVYREYLSVPGPGTRERPFCLGSISIFL